MSNLVKRESNLSSQSTGNPTDSKVIVKSKSKDDSSQGKEQFQQNPEARFLYFLANLANDGLVCVDRPPKLCPFETSSATSIVKDEANDSLDGYNTFGKQDKSDKSNVLHKDIDGCGCSYDTDDDDFKFILGNEFDTDDDTNL